MLQWELYSHYYQPARTYYDPVDTHAISDLRTRGNVTVICSKGSTPAIAMRVGSNAPGIGTTRATLSEANKLSYEIYKDAGLTQVRTQSVGVYLASVACLYSRLK